MFVDGKRLAKDFNIKYIETSPGNFSNKTTIPKHKYIIFVLPPVRRYKPQCWRASNWDTLSIKIEERKHHRKTLNKSKKTENILSDFPQSIVLIFVGYEVSDKSGAKSKWRRIRTFVYKFKYLLSCFAFKFLW